MSHLSLSWDSVGRERAECAIYLYRGIQLVESEQNEQSLMDSVKTEAETFSCFTVRAKKTKKLVK